MLSRPPSRSVSTLAEIPGRLARKSENRLPPSISSRTISIDQRSPTSSIAKAVPQASRYHFPCFSNAQVSFCNFIVALGNSLRHESQVPSRKDRSARGDVDMSQMIFVNLPVTDLPRSMQFYEAVGFTNNSMFTNDQAAAMAWSDEI